MWTIKVNFFLFLVKNFQLKYNEKVLKVVTCCVFQQIKIKEA